MRKLEVRPLVGAKVSDGCSDAGWNLDALLHPERAFSHPSDVLRDPDLTLGEKRAILASWASDACAVEAAPELRSNPHGTLVRWDEIMDALRTLDGVPDPDGHGGNERSAGWRRGGTGDPEAGSYLI